MLEQAFDTLSKLDFAQLIAIGVLLWFMYSRIEKKFDKINQKFDKVDQRFDKVDLRFDKLEEKVTDIDRILCRLEGAFSSKDCCMIKDDRKLSKAE